MPNVLKILVVEEDLESHAALVRLLGHLGYEVRAAGTLREGIAQLQNIPDCIILDLLLPDGCGADLVAEVRKRKLRTRVVVTSDSANTDALKLASPLKPDAFFRKPFEIPQLLGWLRQCEHERGASRLPRYHRNAVA